MLEAKDTVIHLDDIDNGRIPDSYSSLRKALEKQAEISFKAGERRVVESFASVEEEARDPWEFNKRTRELIKEWQGFLKSEVIE